MSAEAAPVPTSPAIDLAAYCRRIGYTGALTATAAVVRALHEAHVGAIVFENLDVLLGRPVRLDLESLQRKMVVGGRGGYCFEQNTLFQAVLEAVGFRVRGLGARVRLGTTGIRPRTHMALLVETEGQTLLADVGFGAHGLLEPLPLASGREAEIPLLSYRLAEEAGLWVLQGKLQGQWTDLYCFTLEPQYAMDYEVANWFTATHPSSIFRQSLTAQRVRREERLLLRNRQFSMLRPEGEERREIASAAEACAVLEEYFGLAVPAGHALPETLFAPA